MRILALLAMCACGGGTSGGGGDSVHGTVHGTTYAIQSAMSATILLSNGSGLAEVLMSTRPDVCADRTANTEQANSSIVALFIEDKVDAHTTAAPTMTGAFTIGATTGASASLLAVSSDATCHDVPGSVAGGSSGTVTLTSISGDAYVGRFDITLDSGEHVTGTFDPEPCPALAGPGSTTMCN